MLRKNGEYQIVRRGTDGRIFVGLASNSTTINSIDTGITAALNTWTHIAVTFDRGDVAIYANGVETQEARRSNRPMLSREGSLRPWPRRSKSRTS